MLFHLKHFIYFFSHFIIHTALKLDVNLQNIATAFGRYRKLMETTEFNPDLPGDHEIINSFYCYKFDKITVSSEVNVDNNGIKFTGLTESIQGVVVC